MACLASLALLAGCGGEGCEFGLGGEGGVVRGEERRGEERRGEEGEGKGVKLEGCVLMFMFVFVGEGRRGAEKGGEGN